MRKILQFHKYLYYRIYSWNLRVWGQSDMPQYNALIGVSFLLALNVVTLWIAIQSVAPRFSLRVADLSHFAWISIFMVIFVADYFLLVHSETYTFIEKEFESETPSQKRKKIVPLALYVLLTFVAFFGLLFLR